MTQRAIPVVPGVVPGTEPLVQWKPETLIPSLMAGLVTGIIGVTRAISYAALIFSGPLAPHLSAGVGMAVFSAGSVVVTAALTSALPGMIATPLAAPTAVLAMMAQDIAQHMQGASSDAVVITVLAAIALTSLLTGVFLLILGLTKQGSKIRIIPYPVVGGFMAGTGWLLVSGFVQMTTDVSLSFAHLPVLCQLDTVMRWFPGVGFALILLLTARVYKHFLVLPGTLLASTGIFYVLLWLTHTPLESARTAGWLLGPFPDGDLWHPLSLGAIGSVNGPVLINEVVSGITIILISLLSLALSNSSIELVVGRDIDLNRELKSIGLANLVSGFGSGMVGSQALPSTLLVHDIGAKTRLTGVIAAVPSLIVLILGSSLLSFLPKAVLGSLILYLGITLLIQWVYDAWFKLPLEDYLTVLVILVVVSSLGFLQGIMVGFIITVITFMYHYSHVDVARQAFSGASTRSNVGRTPFQQEILSKHGADIFILELQGFLFFGTANYLLNKVNDRALGNGQWENTPIPSLRYVIIDLRKVNGIDSSAVLTFNKILKLARKHQFLLIFTNLKTELRNALIKGEGFSQDPTICLEFEDIDRGLEWCESQILHLAEKNSATLSNDLSKDDKTLPQHLEALFLEPEQVERFMKYLEPQEKPASHTLYQQGETNAGLYFIESGQVSVILELEDGRTKRLQTCTAGNLLGEMRFFGKVPLSNLVITDTPSRLYWLSPDAFNQMNEEAPDLVQSLQKFIVGLLCDSLSRREEQLRIIQ